MELQKLIFKIRHKQHLHTYIQLVCREKEIFSISQKTKQTLRFHLIRFIYLILDKQTCLTLSCNYKDRKGTGIYSLFFFKYFRYPVISMLILFIILNQWGSLTFEWHACFIMSVPPALKWQLTIFNVLQNIFCPLKMVGIAEFRNLTGDGRDVLIQILKVIV